MKLDLERLSQREREVFELRMAGQTVPEIAAELFVCRNTIKVFERQIKEKLDPFGEWGCGWWVLCARAYEHQRHGVTCEVEG